MAQASTWPGWPSGDSKLVMEITKTIEQLKDMYGLEFVREEDELGKFQATHFMDEEVGPIVICKYDYSPTGGTMVFADSQADTETVASRVTEALSLGNEDIIGIAI